MEFFESHGISYTSSIDDIKAAFKALALKHHPDKSHDMPGADTFIKIKEAYNLLLERRPPLPADIPDINTNWTEVLENMLDVLTRMTPKKKKKTRPIRTPNPKQSANIQNINANINVSLQDAYYGKVIKLHVNCKKWQSDETFSQDLYISLCHLQDSYTFKAMGDYITETTRGDTIVNVIVDEHEYIKRDTIISKHDLYIVHKISLYEYYYRTYLAVPLFKELLELENLTLSTKRCYICHGKGLPYVDDAGDAQRGHMYVHFELVLPEVLNNNDIKSILQTYFTW